jgi:hypothetical protein
MRRISGTLDDAGLATDADIAIVRDRTGLRRYFCILRRTEVA